MKSDLLKLGNTQSLPNQFPKIKTVNFVMSSSYCMWSHCLIFASASKKNVQSIMYIMPCNEWLCPDKGYPSTHHFMKVGNEPQWVLIFTSHLATNRKSWQEEIHKWDQRETYQHPPLYGSHQWTEWFGHLKLWLPSTLLLVDPQILLDILLLLSVRPCPRISAAKSHSPRFRILLRNTIKVNPLCVETLIKKDINPILPRTGYRVRGNSGSTLRLRRASGTSPCKIRCANLHRKIGGLASKQENP